MIAARCFGPGCSPRWPSTSRSRSGCFTTRAPGERVSRCLPRCSRWCGVRLAWGSGSPTGRCAQGEQRRGGAAASIARGFLIGWVALLPAMFVLAMHVRRAPRRGARQPRAPDRDSAATAVVTSMFWGGPAVLALVLGWLGRASQRRARHRGNPCRVAALVACFSIGRRDRTGLRSGDAVGGGEYFRGSFLYRAKCSKLSTPNFQSPTPQCVWELGVGAWELVCLQHPATLERDSSPARARPARRASPASRARSRRPC